MHATGMVEVRFPSMIASREIDQSRWNVENEQTWYIIVTLLPPSWREHWSLNVILRVFFSRHDLEQRCCSLSIQTCINPQSLTTYLLLVVAYRDYRQILFSPRPITDIVSHSIFAHRLNHIPVMNCFPSNRWQHHGTLHQNSEVPYSTFDC